MSANVQRVVDSINQIRASNGLSQLAVNPLLTQAAQTHVVDMVTNHNHSHVGSDGSSVRMRVERTGYGSGHSSGENWVALTDPNKAVEWWMNSAPHRANILNGNWQEIGVGSGANPNIGLNYYVVVFASQSTGYVAPHVDNSLSTSPAQPTVPAAIPDFHAVQAGETLSSIATRYGLSWQSLATVNNLSEFSLLSIGQSIRLPNGSAVGGPQQSLEIQKVPYTVITGDTLIAIANRFDMPWQDIAFHNGLSEHSVLNIDQILQIPVSVDQLAEEISANAHPLAVPATHTVQSGETIITIALQHQLNWKALLALNALDEHSLLTVGQIVQLR